MRANNDTWRDIYVNGELRHCTPFGENGYLVFIDTPEMPHRRCSCHTFTPEIFVALNNGGMVKTSGDWYSLHPGMPKEE